MNKFEQLIEHVINDEEAKARELFHEIVVEKSREIYEEIMDEEEAKEKDEDLDEAVEEDLDESMDEEMGGDQADDLIDDVEADETGVSMEDEELDDEMVGDEDDHHADVGGDEELEDRVVDLEDKLDELMAEFEALMGDEGSNMDDMDDMGGEEAEMDMDMDVDMDGAEIAADELETEGMMENVDLKAAPKPVTSEEGSINKKSTVAANAGAKGAMAKPVSTGGSEEKGRPAPKAQDMGGTTQPDVKPAVKPVMTQAAGVNTKSTIQ